MDERAYEMLRASVKRFNEWKAYQPTAVDLEGAPLAGCTLHGVDLSQANLKDADFTGADLSGAGLSGAILYRVKAPGAVLARCKMDDVYAAEGRFHEADLSQVRASTANFARAQMAGVNLDHARLVEVSFDEADLTGASLVGALLVRTPIPAAAAPTVNLRDAVVETGYHTPPLSTVDFQYISDDAVTFAIGKWTPRPELSDDEVPVFVRNLRKMARGETAVIAGFAKLAAGVVRKHHRLSACDVMTCVPPSNPEQADDAVRALCAEVARLAKLRDGGGWLVRHKQVFPSGFFSIANDEGKHLDSIRVVHSELVEGRTVLVLDDFVATGCTFRACRHLLLAAGAKQVFCLALARRVVGGVPGTLRESLPP